MNDVRARLREAAIHFADAIYAALRADLLDDLRARPSRTPNISPTPSVDSPAARLVEWVAAHPRTTPDAISVALHWNRSKVFILIGEALRGGTLLKERTGRRVAYSATATGRSRGAPAPAGSEPPRRREKPASTPPLSESIARPRLVVDHVVDYVRDNPGGPIGPLADTLGVNRVTMFRAINSAIAAGLVRRIGPAQYALAGAPVPPRAERKADELISKIVAYVAGNPRCRAGDVRTALGLSESTFFRVAAVAVSRGLLVREGKKPYLRYVSATSPAPLVEVAPAHVAPTVIRRATRALSGESLVEAVIEFVRANPECRNKQLAAATGAGGHPLHVALRAARLRGAIRLEGERIKTRYFPVGPAVSIPHLPPAVTQAPATHAASRPLPLLEPDAAATEAVESLYREVDEAIGNGSHDIRLGALLQAIVAEARQLQPRVPEGHPAARRLDTTIRRITAIRGERNLAYIVGLKRGASGDWARLSRDARQRVAQFDLDAEATAPKSKPPRPPKPVAAEESGGENAVESLPCLTTVAEEKSIVLVGGIKKNEVLDQVRRRYGFDVEWAAMQGANARAADAMVDRIKHGNVGAVVVLEALTGTTQVKSVIAACKVAGVPYAYGGAAGRESLRSALREIEASAGASVRLGAVP